MNTLISKYYSVGCLEQELSSDLNGLKLTNTLPTKTTKRVRNYVFDEK